MQGAFGFNHGEPRPPREVLHGGRGMGTEIDGGEFRKCVVAGKIAASRSPIVEQGEGGLLATPGGKADQSSLGPMDKKMQTSHRDAGCVGGDSRGVESFVELGASEL